jgi:hypothetical protein
MAFEKAEFAKQKSMGKLDFGSQLRASKRDKFLNLSEFANFPWVTHFGPQLPQNQSLKRHYASTAARGVVVTWHNLLHTFLGEPPIKRFVDGGWRLRAANLGTVFPVY